MRQQQLLLSFLPGFAPILVYILIDAVFGETAGLVAGMALGIGEFVFILIWEKRLDAFTLVDTVLLAVMGALSWALSDPVFFRLKPAVSGTVLALMMIAGSLGPHRLFLPYMQNKMGMGELPEAAVKKLLAMIAGFGFLTLAHSALTAVAALYWSRLVWDFIAGALFWILAFVYMAAWTIPGFVGMARVRAASRAPQASRTQVPPQSWLQAESEGFLSSDAPGEMLSGEMLPIVDETGKVLGKASRSACHTIPIPGSATHQKKILHPVVRLWLTDAQGGYWMQKRSTAKLVQPGKWDCAVGGHVSYGETAELSLRREASEEIGLADLSTLSNFRTLFCFIWETIIERELVFVYLAEIASADGLKADAAEVDEIRLWTAKEIKAELAKGEDAREFTELARVELAKGL